MKLIEKSVQNVQLISDPAALDDAVDAWERILNHSDFLRAEQSILSSAKNDAGSLYLRCYWARGRISDLNRALVLYQQTVAATPEGHPNLAMYLNNLGIGFMNRFKRTGRIDDLNEAIKICKQAVAATPEGDPNLAGNLSNLGSGFMNRFERAGHIDDLEEAIKIYKQAVAATPEGHPNLANLNNLGIGFMNRFERTGRIDDLEEAIKVCKQVVQATPEGHPNFAVYLTNLGNGFMNRFKRTGRIDDLNKAIKICKQSVEATPEGHPNLAVNLTNLGNELRKRFELTDCIDDLKDAIRSYRQACGLGLRAAPEETVHAGRNWQRWAFQRGSWMEVIEAYSFIEHGMEQWISNQFSRMDKSFSLGGVQGLAAQAAYAHFQLDQLKEAVEALEAGRAQLLREALERQRRDLYSLPELGFKDLSEKFIEASGRYDALLAQAHSEIRPADWVEQMEGASREMQSAAESIRKSAGAKHPQYRFFRKSLPLEEIQKQANEAPLVYLAATSSGGMAIIVNVTHLKVIELLELSNTALRRTVQGPDDEPLLGGYLGAYMRWRDNCNDLNAKDAWSKTLDKTTRWLWETIMGKVLVYLEAKGIREAVLIPTGLLGLLPLHAAWTEDLSLPTGRRYALDDVTFTYAPSAQALFHARQGAGRPTDTLLAVENPDGTLHFTEPEVKSVLSHFPGKYNHLLRDQARKEAVVQAIGSSHVLHFSTHGLAGWQEAESSRLKLADGDLILTELFGLHLDQARLAVLSACETGVPGTELPDEVISLPSAWMQAGMPGVVGSLWSVDDMSTAMLMARFYDLWRDDGLSAPEALRRAQIWLRDSTVEELMRHFKVSIEPRGFRMSADVAKSFYKEVGWEDPKARFFEHPLYWAAFGYTGL